MEDHKAPEAGQLFGLIGRGERKISLLDSAG